MSKRILCFGDSNTWGYDPANRAENGAYHVRYPSETRWTGRMKGLLGEGYTVIEEGLNGRTTVWDDPVLPFRNGLGYLEACLWSHEPLDLVIIMLGTNDLKPRICGRAFDVAEGVGRLAQCVQASACGRKGRAPKALIVSPAAVDKAIERLPFCDEFGGINAHEQSLKLPGLLAAKAEDLGCHFLDAARYAGVAVDGVHLDEANHAGLASAMAEKVKGIL